MIRRILYVFGILLFATAAFAQTSIEGNVKTSDEEPVLYGLVVLFKSGVEISQTETDFEGYYSISNIDPGTYDIEFSSIGAQTQIIEGVVAYAGKTTTVNAELQLGVAIEEVEIIGYKVPLIEQDNTTQGDIVTGKQIQNLPIKDVNAIASNTAGASSIDNGAVSIRGSRTGNTVYIIDGVRTTGRVIPQSEIEQLQIMTGGIPANIGDVTGGVISLTTKGPSQRYTGGLELETSKFLDPYDYNLISGNLSGPIWKKEERSVIGFRVSGQYRYLGEDNPSYKPRYYASQEALDNIAQDPVFIVRGTPFNTGETLRDEEDGGSVIESKTRKNDDLETLDLTGKLDFQLAPGLDLSVSGSYFDTKNRFTGDFGGVSFSLLNWDRNPYIYNDGYRINARVRHRLGGNNFDSDEENKPKGFIRNVSYTLQGAYEISNSRREDVEHEDNFFNYGYIGKYNRSFRNVLAPEEGATSPLDTVIGGKYVPSLQNPEVGQWYVHKDVAPIDDADNFFEPNFEINPILARMAETDGNLVRNGFISTSVRDVWGLYANRGMVYNTYNKSNDELFSGQASLNFDLFPGGSDKGRHNVELGFLIEQRIDRNYTLAPQTLWELASQLSNSKLSGIDYTKPIPEEFITQVFNGQEYQFQVFEPKVDADVGNGFFKRFRDANGIPYSSYVNVDEYTPDQLSLDYFSPDELSNQQLIGYHGYDYLGNAVGSDVTFTDFFKADNANREVAAFTPIYYAGYIQDKFSYKDLIMRLGVRVDFYDANTKVMKDPQSLYPIMTAAEFHNLDRVIADKPLNVGDDYLVYYSREENEAFGYRKGETWYDADGNEIGGEVLWSTRTVNAKFGEDLKRIRDEGFDVDGSFKDYETQISIMPRLAFSFPISEEANFFAHYDILTQRPSSGNSYVSPLQYYYFDSPDRAPIANSMLRPEKTVDYEVGFQQKLTSSSALKIAAYYKELRDMMQRRTLLYLPGGNPQRVIYDNIDFGTVYGFSFTYDLRRTGNIQFKAGYTLQFARGTGSNADSQAGLTRRGNLRNLFYFDYDERHRFTLNLDYRYGSGKDYNGPKIGDVELFSEMGLNVQANIVSGRPYTVAQGPTLTGWNGIEGGLNESRLPWVFSLDARLDKNIRISSKEAKRPLYLNVYLRGQNIFNVENVIGVYRYSQSPNDPGFLEFDQGQVLIDDIQSGIRSNTDADIEAFYDAYNWATQVSGFYTRPRRLYFGVIFQF